MACSFAPKSILLFGLAFLLLTPWTPRAQGASAQPLPRKDSFFGLHFDIHAQAGDTMLGQDVSEQNITALLDAAMPDFLQWDLKGAYGYASYPTTVGYPAPGIAKDAMPILRRVTRQHAVALYGYYSGLADQQAVAHHPQWARVNAGGVPSTISVSTFSGYTKALMVPQLQEAATRYGLDGFWVDGEALSAGLDYSPAAQLAWRAGGGIGAPPVQPADPRWFAWKQFNRQQFLVHLNAWVNGIHSIAGVQVGSNWTFSANAPEPVTAGVDFLTGDFAKADGLDPPRLEGRYLSSTGVPWDLMAWGFIHAGPANYQVRPAAEIEQAAGAVLMQGGGFEIYHHPSRGGYVSNEIIRQVAAVAAFCRERQAVSFKSVAVPQVALIASANTYMDQCQTAFSANGQWNKLLGVMHALLEAHYSVDVLSESQLQPRLWQYPLVVLPDAYAVGADCVRALTQYVNQGGHLLVIGARSALQLATPLHVAFIGKPMIVPAFVHTSMGYASCDGYWQEVTALPGTHVLMWRHGTLPPFHDPPAIAATISHFGKGQAIGLYGPMAIDYFQRPDDASLRQTLIDPVRTLFPRPAVELDGPATVDLSLRRTATGQLCVHLLNRGPAATPPMHLHLLVDKEPRSLHLEPGHLSLHWNRSSRRIGVVVPPLAIHGVVVLD